MKKILKIVTLFLTISGIVFPGLANSQDILTFFDGQGIHLRWKGVRSLDLEGYNVYRQSRGSNQWELLNDQPLVMTTSRAEIEQIAGFKSAMFLQLFGIRDANTDITPAAYGALLNNREAVSFMEVMCLVNPELGKLLGEIFFDSTIVIGQSYMYKVEAIVNGAITEIGQTLLLQTTTPDIIPTITELNGRGLDEKVMLNWPRNQQLLSSGQVVTYRVYRSDNLLGPYHQRNLYGILSVTVTSGDLRSNDSIEEHLDSYLENGRSYFYYVKAVNAFGLESAESITLEIISGSDLVPSPPTGINAALLGDKLRLEWDAPAGEMEGYNIYKSIDEPNSFEQVYPLSDAVYNTVNNWIDFSVTEGNGYYYYLESVNNGLVSRPSDTIFFYYTDQTPPAAPVSVYAETKSGEITIRWDRNIEPNLIGYEVERASDDIFRTRFLLTATPVIDTFYVDVRPAESQTTYGYVVYAIDAGYNRSLPSKMVKAKMPDITPPQSPIMTGLERNDKTISLKWAPGNDKDLLKYQIYQSFNQNDFELIGESVVPGFQTEIELSGTYRFAATAVDSSNNESDLSKPVFLTYDALAYPEPPEKARGNVNKEMHVELTWNASPSPNVTGYMITRIDLENDAIHDIADLPVDSLEYIDRSVVRGKSYRYEIRAYNAAWRMSFPATVDITIE